MFRRGRRHEALTELSSPGVDEQPSWLPGHGQGDEPERVPVAHLVAQVRYDTRSPAPSPLRDVSTEEVLEALGTVFTPTELDWELVGVTFVYSSPIAASPAHLAVEVMVEDPPSAAEVHAPPTETPAPSRIGRAAAPRKRRKWLPEHDEIMAAVRELSWEGYRSLIADIFRREGYEVFEGEGPDGDVIDMEVVRGADRMLVNCQLRGLGQIGVEPLSEMAQVARRSGADAAFIISDGDFAPEAWSLADREALILIDRENLLGLVLDLTIGEGDRSLRAHVGRLLSALQPGVRRAS